MLSLLFHFVSSSSCLLFCPKFEECECDLYLMNAILTSLHCHSFKF